MKYVVSLTSTNEPGLGRFQHRPRQAKGMTRDYLDRCLAAQPCNPWGLRNRHFASGRAAGRIGGTSLPVPDAAWLGPGADGSKCQQLSELGESWHSGTASQSVSKVLQLPESESINEVLERLNRRSM